MNSIAITGTSGFLGANVKKLFEIKGYVVTSLPNISLYHSLEHWKSDVESILDLVKPDAIINIAAAQNGGDYFSDICSLTNSNIIMPAFFASYMQANNQDGQLLTIATSWQFDQFGNYKPFNLYSASKQASDDYLKHYALNGLKITSLILFDTFSEFDTRKKIHNLIRNALKNKEVLEMTAGDQLINMIHVSDAANAVLTAFEQRNINNEIKLGFRQWAIKSAYTIQVKNLLDFINNKTLLEYIRLGKRPYRDREIFLIHDQFEIVPNWVPQVDVYQCIKSMINNE